MIYLHFKWGGGYTKSEVDTLLNGKADTSHTHTKSQITDFPSYGTTANTICEGNDSRLSDARTPTSHTHTKSEITDFPSLATVATSGSYNDLTNKPTIPTVNNATLKIQKNGTDVKTFTANASTDVTCNISVPTKTSDLTNDSGFLTSHQSLSNYSTLANTVKSLSISGKTITVTPGSGNAYTLTTQDTTYTHPTSSGNKHIPSGGSSGQFLGWSADGTAKWVNNPNTNTDTLMTQNVSTTNATYPVLLVAAADATANQGAKTGIFAKSVKVNPSTNVISASGFVGPLTGNVTGNCSGSSGSCTGNAANVTGTVAIGHGGTGATTRLGAVQNLTNENVGTSTEYFLTITTNWGKAGYCSVANAKSVLGIPTVNNATLTIQKNGSNVATFTANASSNVTANITVPTKVSQLTNDSGFLTSADLLPIGSYIQFAGSQAPAGFLVCNGGAISRTTYSKLFAVIGTTYGSGNGSTTFNLPNLTDRFLQGSTTSGTVKNAGLPNITGNFNPFGEGKKEYGMNTSGSFYLISSNQEGIGSASIKDNDNCLIGFKASLSSSIYGSSSTVQPPALTCLICIKY